MSKVDRETPEKLDCPISPQEAGEDEDDDEQGGSGDGDRHDDADSVASSSKSLLDRKPRRTSSRIEDKSEIKLDEKIFRSRTTSRRAPSHDQDTFLVAPKRRNSRSGSSSEIVKEDLYGISRGKCNECGLCEVYMTAASGSPTQSCYRILCLYCGCPPTYHEVQGSQKAAKRRISDNLVIVEASSKKGKKNKTRLPKSDKKAIGPNDVRQGGK